MRWVWDPRFKSEYGLTWIASLSNSRFINISRGVGKLWHTMVPYTPTRPWTLQVECYYGNAQVRLPCWSLSILFCLGKKKKKSMMIYWNIFATISFSRNKISSSYIQSLFSMAVANTNTLCEMVWYFTLSTKWVVRPWSY